MFGAPSKLYRCTSMGPSGRWGRLGGWLPYVWSLLALFGLLLHFDSRVNGHFTWCHKRCWVWPTRPAICCLFRLKSAVGVLRALIVPHLLGHVIYNRLAQVAWVGTGVIFCWLASHVEVAGIERADVATANSAVALPYSDYVIGLRSAVKTVWKER